VAGEAGKVAEERTPAKRGSVRAEYKARTRQRLADAAFAEFEERGYAACTIDDVARRAGTSRATFYVHYASKAELAEGLWDVTRLSLIALYRELARYPRRDRATVEGWMAKTFDFYATHRRRLLAVHEAIALEPLLAEVYHERTREVANLVAPLILERTAGVSAHFRASLLTVQHERFCYLWILRGVPFDRDEAIRGLAEVWFEQIGTPGA